MKSKNELMQNPLAMRSGDSVSKQPTKDKVWQDIVITKPVSKHDYDKLQKRCNDLESALTEAIKYLSAAWDTHEDPVLDQFREILKGVQNERPYDTKVG